jgi:hypothetical protein
MYIDRSGNTNWQKRHSKGSTKQMKYKSLCTMTKRLWNVKCLNIPLIIGATGIVTMCLKKNLKATSEENSICILSTKTTVLGKSHVIRKVLQSETWTLSGGDHRWFKRSTEKKTPVTRDDIDLIWIIIILKLFINLFVQKCRPGGGGAGTNCRGLAVRKGDLASNIFAHVFVYLGSIRFT